MMRAEIVVKNSCNQTRPAETLFLFHNRKQASFYGAADGTRGVLRSLQRLITEHRPSERLPAKEIR